MEGGVWGDGMTIITGATKRVSFLEINSMPVSLEENGNFTVTRAYPTGYTALQAVARDRFGRAITKTITFVVTHNAKKENEKGPPPRTFFRQKNSNQRRNRSNKNKIRR